jgi:hypothetical protein
MVAKDEPEERDRRTTPPAKAENPVFSLPGGFAHLTNQCVTGSLPGSRHQKFHRRRRRKFKRRLLLILLGGLVLAGVVVWLVYFPVKPAARPSTPALPDDSGVQF